MPCRIELASFELELHIGCTEPERQAVQAVRFTLAVASTENFPACKTDLLADTLDVAALRANLAEVAGSVRVHTLERLGKLLEEGLLRCFPARGLTWELTIAKLRHGWTYVHTWTT